MIEELNPWWEERDWEKKDKHIRDWKNQRIRWVPKWTEQISLKPFSLNFVIGARQVGKTTGLKLLIRKLLESGIHPKAIIYFNLELLSDTKEFREIIKKYLDIKKEEGIKHGYLFLDEVTRLPGWDRIIKGFIDMGALDNDVVIVTGSGSVHLLKHTDAFPGRKGKGKKVFVHPLGFGEFVEVHGIDLKKKRSNEEKIRKLFEKYLFTGGFPLSVNDIGFYEDFMESLDRELFAVKKSPKTLRQIISSLLETVPSATSYNSLGNRIGISHYVVSEYLEILEDLFITKTAYLRQNNKVMFRREKKIFFRDPFIYKVFSLITNKEMRRDVLYEHIVQEHLFRKFGEIYYYRNKYEIDCIAGDMRIEVKAGKPHRRYPRGVTVLEEEDIAWFLLDLKI